MHPNASLICRTHRHYDRQRMQKHRVIKLLCVTILNFLDWKEVYMDLPETTTNYKYSFLLAYYLFALTEVVALTLSLCKQGCRISWCVWGNVKNPCHKSWFWLGISAEENWMSYAAFCQYMARVAIPLPSNAKYSSSVFVKCSWSCLVNVYIIKYRDYIAYFREKMHTKSPAIFGGSRYFV